MRYLRNTMGQDGPGRPKANPTDAPKVTSKQVYAFAEQHSLIVKRSTPGAWSMWWVKDADDEWRTVSNTNYHALESLGRIAQEGLKVWTERMAG
ncbi:MAG: hypothetical protein JSS66_06855 [Armatimonadetes bacterium]|nr:hypothetical protein [Armatimonadota bacterium]